MNINNLTDKNKEALNEAYQLAVNMQNPEITIIHLLKVLLKDSNGLTYNIFKKANLPLNEVNDYFDNELKKITKISNSDIGISRYLNELYNHAEKMIKKNQESYISTEHIILALFASDDPIIKQLIRKFSINESLIKNIILSTKDNKKANKENSEDNYQVLEKYGRNIVELVSQGKIDPIIGRNDEIRHMIQILSRKTKNNPVLVGEPGVGKTALVEGLAWRIFKKDVPMSLLDKTVYELDMASLIAGAKYRGEFEERLKNVLDEIKSSEGKIILFIDEIHLLIGTGKTDGAMDAANILKPLLARGELHCIGATTFDEYRKYIEKDKALERRMQPIQVKEPTVEETITILRGLKQRFEIFHGVKITDNALVAASTLANRYITNRFLPDKAIDLVDEACAKVRVQIDSMPIELDEIIRKIMQLTIEEQALSNETDNKSLERIKVIQQEIANLKEQEKEFKIVWDKEKASITKLKDLKKELEEAKVNLEKVQQSYNYEQAAKLKYSVIPSLEKQIIELESLEHNESVLNEVVGEENIEEVVSLWTNIPVSKLTSSKLSKVLQLEENLKKRVISQEEAISLISDAIKRSQAKINDENRPIGSFLFLGPTGVGKTEVAKALAEQLFDSEKHIIRIDMSEYMEKFSVSRLIGAPPGYVGYEEGGQLTEAVRRSPYSIILLDEIEKADKEVFNLLLQILDEGRCTDSKGVVVDFKNTIFIMTSNIGSEYLFNQEYSQATKLINAELKQNFKPEFLNRIDEIIIFNKLNEQVIHQIIDKFIQEFNKRLKSHNITIELTVEAKKQIASEGFDINFGARPIKRFIQKNIETLVANNILENKIKYDKNIIDYKEKFFIL